jgi:hypothetical protein
MRKFGITFFAVLYGIFVIYVSAERVSEWAAQEALRHGHLADDQHFSSFGKSEKSETPVPYKRIIERSFVVESPRDCAGIAMDSMRHEPLPSFEYQAAWSRPTVSSRAPPFQI